MFYERGTSVVTDAQLEEHERPKYIRSSLQDLYDEGIVRTYTIEGRNENGAPWNWYHFALEFPGQDVVRVNGERET